MIHRNQLNLLHQNEHGVWGKYIGRWDTTACFWREADPTELAMVNGKRRAKANKELNDTFAKWSIKTERILNEINSKSTKTSD